MKRTIAILLVAIMAVGSAFAAFSGSAQVGVGADFEKGNYGFIDNSTKVDFNIDLATASAEAISEGDVYASIKGSLGLVLVTDEDDIDAIGDSNVLDPEFVTNFDDGTLALGIYAKIDEAKVAGENWYISLLGVPGGPDFAKSAIDTYKVKNDKTDFGNLKADYDENVTYSVPYIKAPGVEVGIFDYKIGFGFKANAQKDPFKLVEDYGVTAYVATPEYDLNGLTFQVAGAYSATNNNSKDFSNKDDGPYNAIGASAKVGFTNDAFAVSAATDFGYDIENEKFGMDAVANFTYDFVTVDAFYATEAKTNQDKSTTENLLSTQVKVDLNTMDMPLAITVSAKDLVNKQDLDAKVEIGLGAFTLTPAVGYVIDTEKFNAGIDVAYAHEYFTVKGAFSLTTQFEDRTTQLKASASIESASVIPGATVKLAWSNGNDLLNYGLDSDGHTYGKVVASIKMAF